MKEVNGVEAATLGVKAKGKEHGDTSHLASGAGRPEQVPGPHLGRGGPGRRWGLLIGRLIGGNYTEF